MRFSSSLGVIHLILEKTSTISQRNVFICFFLSMDNLFIPKGKTGVYWSVFKEWRCFLLTDFLPSPNRIKEKNVCTRLPYVPSRKLRQFTETWNFLIYYFYYLMVEFDGCQKYLTDIFCRKEQCVLKRLLVRNDWCKLKKKF